MTSQPKSQLDSHYDVSVIGAGPAGTVAAAFLKAAGHKVAIFERARFPRFVIGESLLPICNDVLEAARLFDKVQAQNYQVKTGAVFLRGTETCEYDFGQQFTDGTAWSWQVPRADFDNVLAEGVQEMGVPVFFRARRDCCRSRCNTASQSRRAEWRSGRGLERFYYRCKRLWPGIGAASRSGRAIGAVTAARFVRPCQRRQTPTRQECRPDLDCRSQGGRLDLADSVRRWPVIRGRCRAARVLRGSARRSGGLSQIDSPVELQHCRSACGYRIAMGADLDR